MRSFGADASRPYVEALEARELPHLLVGGNAFHSREEVETLTTALAAIERPVQVAEPTVTRLSCAALKLRTPRNRGPDSRAYRAALLRQHKAGRYPLVRIQPNRVLLRPRPISA